MKSTWGPCHTGTPPDPEWYEECRKNAEKQQAALAEVGWVISLERDGLGEIQFVNPPLEPIP